MSYVLDDIEYLTGSAGSLVLACPACGEEQFREPMNYFWSLVPENKAWMAKGQTNYFGDPSWHKCMSCGTQMEPIRTDQLETRWNPLWRSLGHQIRGEDY